MKHSKYLFIFLGLLTITSVGAWFGLNRTGEVKAQDRNPDETEYLELEAQGGGVNIPTTECMTEATRKAIKADLDRSVAKLRAEGKLPSADAEAAAIAPSFIWPVIGAAGATNDFGVHGISNFVDQNPAFPNQLRDYNCGTRTYDQASGYNHAGIDIFTWPFGWNKMDNSEVMIIAADAGTIIQKFDGNTDRSCSFNGNNWNAVYLRHSDGTVTWYGHMKRNSTTTKAVGDTVVKGEYLGIVGSSGNSTGPHLHLETYGPTGALNDPFIGTCNTLSSTVYWEAQKPYYDSKINKMMTHRAPPSFQTCPNPDIINEKRSFRFGELFHVANYYRDQQTGHVSTWSLIRPNGTVYQTWNHTSPASYAASYWYYDITIPNTQPAGQWKVRTVYQSVTTETSFNIGQVPFDYTGDGKADISIFRPTNGYWYVNNSANGSNSINQFGVVSDVSAPADFDGDGRTDLAVFRSSNGAWYWLNSGTGTVGANQFGSNGDKPTPGDFDGDGKADLGIFRPSTGYWWALRSSNGSVTAQQFGANGDKPTLGDFDGDNRTDLAVYRPSNGTWYRTNSASGTFVSANFGLSTDSPAPADFDGDGKTDIAIYRPSTGNWFWVGSLTGNVNVNQFGASGDLPATADYDGDGRADLAVFRPSQGFWYLLRTTSGFGGQQYGASGDVPTPGSFVQ